MNIVAGEAAHEALTELHHFVFAFIDRLHPNSVGGAAIGFTHNDILGHIHQLAGYIAGVSGLERRISQTFARAVSRDEVFQHR